MGDSSLRPEELLRYRRHIAMPEVGEEGQRRLKQSSVLCVGAGGLGSPLLLYLAAAGVGRIGIVDDDAVDLSNMHRQILYGTPDIGVAKTVAAGRRLRETNPHVEIVPHPVRFAAENGLDLVRQYEIVADGSDNFATRYLVNDACVLAGRPNVHASIFRFEGQISLFDARTGPCYRCLFPIPPPPGTVPSCAEAGVLGVLPGIVGSLQALETIKWLLRRGESLAGRLVLIDTLAFAFREVAIRKDPACLVCGSAPAIGSLAESEIGCGTDAGETAPAAAASNMTAPELAERLAGGADLVILDVREPFEQRIAEIPGSRLVPLGDLNARLPDLDPDRDYVVYCHTGSRSAVAASVMRRAGFARVWNLAGGIDAWSTQIDPSVARY